jgi:hypothetical protein
MYDTSLDSKHSTVTTIIYREIIPGSVMDIDGIHAR